MSFVDCDCTASCNAHAASWRNTLHIERVCQIRKNKKKGLQQSVCLFTSCEYSRRVPSLAHIGECCTFGSPFEKMNSLVSLKHHKTKRCEGEEGRVPRHVLKGNLEKKKKRENIWTQINHKSNMFCCDVKVRSNTFFVLSRNSAAVLKKKTLHGCGSTPYVSSIWAFCRKFRSDVSGVCPLGGEQQHTEHLCQSTMHIKTCNTKRPNTSEKRHQDNCLQLLWYINFKEG